MFNFFRNSAHADVTDSRPVPHAAPQSTSPPPSVRPHTDIQRELVRVVLKDTMRRHGIPFEWLACEVHTVTTSVNNEELHIHLVLMQWHELLLRYAPALEIQLLRGLDRFEPTVDHAKKCTITWRFSPECGSPFTVMPPPLVWAHDAPAEPVAAEPPSILDRRQKKRPQKSDGAAATKPAATTPKRGDGEYERTELSPFR